MRTRALVALLMLLAGAASADDGGVGLNTFVYSGNLRNNLGPITGAHTIRFAFSNGVGTCMTPDVDITADDDGNFSTPVPVDACAADFFNGNAITYTVHVDGVQIAANVPFGAVPYARLAERALHADSADSATTAQSAATATNATNAQYAASTTGARTSNIARRSQAPLSLHVRIDGNDLECDGSADAAYSIMAAPACAVATPQTAIDMLPEVLNHVASITIHQGIYYGAGAGTVSMRIARPLLNLVIQGDGNVVLSGASMAAPTVPVAYYGLEVRNARVVTISNINFERFIIGIGVADAQVAMASVTSSNNAAHGLVAYSGEVSMSGPCAFNSNGSAGAGHGIVMFNTRLSHGVSGTFTANSNIGSGVYATDMSTVSFGGAGLNLVGNRDVGLVCQFHTLCTVGTPSTVGSSAVGFSVNLFSWLNIYRPTTVTNVLVGLGVANTSQANVAAPTGQPAAMSFTGNGQPGSVGISVASGAIYTSSGPGTLAVSGFSYAVGVSLMSAFVDGGGRGQMRIAGTVAVSGKSFYSAGDFPLAVGCLADCTCQ